MKRVNSLFILLCLCCLLTGGWTQSSERQATKKACPFSIVGTWKSLALSEREMTVFSFAPDGWVRLLTPSANTLAQDLEVLAEVKYKLNNPSSPTRIEFTARRGNDVFPTGGTALEITEFSADSFTTKHPVTGAKTPWVREQTHRYFLSLAARQKKDSPQIEAVAMWTVLDGRKTTVYALGVERLADADDRQAADKEPTGSAATPPPLFAPVSARLTDELVMEDEEDGEFMMRLELNAAEFERSHAIFAAWEKQVTEKTLPFADAYQNSLEFMHAVAESLNHCEKRLHLPKPQKAAADQPPASFSQQVLAFIKALRKLNDETHVNNVMYPLGWRPQEISADR